MPELSVGNSTLFYQISPHAGPESSPLLCIHGAGGSSHLWHNQLPLPINGYAQLALDLPGHARSKGSGQASVEAYAQWIIDFIRELGCPQCVLAGHSMGGAITLAVALAEPNLLRAMILIGTGARLRVTQEVLTRAIEGAALTEYAYAPDTPLSIKQEAEKEFGLTSPEVRYYDFLACDGFDYMQRISEIKTPTLIICGEQDQLTPPKYSQYLHQHIPNSRLEIIPQAGHMVMWEQATACNRAIKDFMAKLV
ncbi:MAG: alpha/beta hydrolase [Desulfovermiculus sp.]|nr:alpha/beta hydrolase [Desulfovermiculus sp.]